MSEETAVSPSEQVEQLSGTERAEWLKTGDLPSGEPAAEPPKEPPAAPAAEEPEESRFQAAKPEEKPEKKPTSMGYGELRKHAKALEEENRRLREQTKPPAAEAPKPEPAKAAESRPKPTPADKDDKGNPKFKTYEEFLEDLSDWKVEQRIAKLEQDTAKKTAEQQVATEQRAISERWAEQVTAARAKHADFDTVALDKDLPIPAGSAVEQWVLDSEIGTDILYHLASHPDELREINAMPPVKAARALTILEAELTDAAPAAPPAKTTEPPADKGANRVSKAPPPAREVGSRGSAAGYSAAEEALANGDFDAYRRHKNAEEVAARRG